MSSGPQAAVSRIVRMARAEDILLVAWVALGWPIVESIIGPVGGVDVSSTTTPLAAAITLAAVGAALVCLTTRNAEDSPDAFAEHVNARMSASGALLAGMAIVAYTASRDLAYDGPDIGGLIFLFGMIVFVAQMVVPARFPTLPRVIRRALVVPFILVAASLFNATVGDIAGDFRLDRLGSAPPEIGGAVGFASILVLVMAVFYAMLVFAPRQIAEQEGRPLTWLIRFGLYVAGTLLGVGVVRALGM